MTSSTAGRSRVVALGAGVALLTGALFAGSVLANQAASAAGGNRPVPISRQVESSSGIRVIAAHVVGSGGIVELTYQVLDPTKASIVEGDVAKTPKLTRVGSGDTLQNTAAMRHGHTMRSAGTYFLLYYNQGGAVKAGDSIDVTISGTTLTGVPVT
ncbi:MAG TPA: hypothetical protein VIJ41_16310 [Candidatus Nanopelagicales bacterium]